MVNSEVFGWQDLREPLYYIALNKKVNSGGLTPLVLETNSIKISMDGKGRALDNVYVERLWRSLKYENIFINDYRNLKELRGGVNLYFKFYNTERFHQSLAYQTPDEVYFSIERQGVQSVGHVA